MESQGAAKSRISRDAFLASKSYVDEKCNHCQEPIKYGDEIRYYGGPFIIHSACLKVIFELA